MKVKALKLGYYGERRIREGQVFHLKPIKVIRRDKKNGDLKKVIIPVEDQFSSKWMWDLSKGENPPEFPDLEDDEKEDPVDAILNAHKKKREAKQKNQASNEDSTSNQEVI